MVATNSNIFFMFIPIFGEDEPIDPAFQVV